MAETRKATNICLTLTVVVFGVVLCFIYYIETARRKPLAPVASLEATVNPEVVRDRERRLSTIDPNKEPVVWCTEALTLAMDYESLGRFSEQETLLTRILQIDQVTYGIDSAQVYRDCGFLASYYEKCKQPGNAFKYQEIQLAYLNRTYGSLHDSKRAFLLAKMAHNLRLAGNSREAEKHLRRAIEFDLSVHGLHLNPWTERWLGEYITLLVEKGMTPQEADQTIQALKRGGSQ